MIGVSDFDVVLRSWDPDAHIDNFTTRQATIFLFPRLSYNAYVRLIVYIT